MERCPSDPPPFGQGGIAIHSPAVAGESGFDLIFYPGPRSLRSLAPGYLLSPASRALFWKQKQSVFSAYVNGVGRQP
jgi:hypothetical protein